MQCPSRIRSGVREAAPWQGPGRGPPWAPLQRTQDPGPINHKALAPPGPPPEAEIAAAARAPH